MEDYYQILGIPPQATAEEIGKRYRFLAQAYHPDKFANEQHKTDAAVAFKQIHEAFATLSNAGLRAAYDSKRDYFLQMERRSPPRAAQPQPAPTPPPEPPKPKPSPEQPKPKQKPPPEPTRAAPRPEPVRRESPLPPRRHTKLVVATAAIVLTTSAASALYFNRELFLPAAFNEPASAPTPQNESTTAAPSPEILASNSLGMKFAKIPAGDYWVGSPDSELNSFGKHEPRERRRQVRIAKPFAIGLYAVTQAEYEQVTGKNPSFFSKSGGGRGQVAGQGTGRFPVEQVSWFDAAEFCNRLSEREGRTPCYQLTNIGRNGDTIKAADMTSLPGTGFRLPSEAEWEIACRVGTTTAYHFGDSLNGREANCKGSDPYGTSLAGPFLERTAAVGSYPPNAFGLHDMHGNVRQWCEDCYDDSNTTTSILSDPRGPASGKQRVARGGGWGDSAVNCRAAYCFQRPPDYREKDLGFRVVTGGE